MCLYYHKYDSIRMYNKLLQSKKEVRFWKVIRCFHTNIEAPHYPYEFHYGYNTAKVSKFNIGKKDIIQVNMRCSIIPNHMKRLYRAAIDQGIHVFVNKKDAEAHRDSLMQVRGSIHYYVIPVTVEARNFIAAGTNKDSVNTAVFRQIFISKNAIWQVKKLAEKACHAKRN